MGKVRPWERPSLGRATCGEPHQVQPWPQAEVREEDITFFFKAWFLYYSGCPREAPSTWTGMSKPVGRMNRTKLLLIHPPPICSCGKYLLNTYYSWPWGQQHLSGEWKRNQERSHPLRWQCRRSQGIHSEEGGGKHHLLWESSNIRTESRLRRALVPLIKAFFR